MPKNKTILFVKPCKISKTRRPKQLEKKTQQTANFITVRLISVEKVIQQEK